MLVSDQLTCDRLQEVFAVWVFATIGSSSSEPQSSGYLSTQHPLVFGTGRPSALPYHRSRQCTFPTALSRQQPRWRTTPSLGHGPTPLCLAPSLLSGSGPRVRAVYFLSSASTDTKLLHGHALLLLEWHISLLMGRRFWPISGVFQKMKTISHLPRTFRPPPAPQ